MNNKNKINIPPGFKPSPLGPIPSDWEINEVNDIVSGLANGVTYDPDSTSGYPITRIETIADGLINPIKVGLTPFSESLEKFKLKKGDILYSHINSVAHIGKTAYCEKDYEILHGMNLLRLIPKSNIDSKLLYYLLNSKYARKQAYSAAKRAVNQASLSTAEIRKFILPVPPINEQRSITSILSTWDSAISKTLLLINLLKLRNSVLQYKLLTGNNRLKGFENKWKKKKIEDCLIYTPREVPKPSSSFFALGIRSHGKGIFHKNDFDPEDLAMDVLFVVKENDFILNITFAWEQAIAIAGKQDDGGLVSHRFPTYTFNLKNAIPEYFRYFILQKYFKYQLGLISPGGAGRNRVLSKKDLLKLNVIIPEVDEQLAIANVLKQANKELKIAEQKFETLKQQKRGLMQILLTGKKRLIN